MNYKRTNSSDPHFQELIRQLDADLTITNGEAQAKFAEFNRVDKVNWVIIAYHKHQPIGCGGFKINGNRAEIKRMFVNKNYRGQKIGEQILKELESWARQEGIRGTLLETGTNQYEAQNLYKKLGYTIIPNYGPYLNFSDSICMAKDF
ncbi:MAG: GNAT family N-acetyltransferase [Bacteroidetes bacterium HGW-Bacteroidetes-4]|nr:MAG: GNAT family N-acetyltransferase [Bacteroidetes bacterium HGW-Bacteroidetes-4]